MAREYWTLEAHPRDRRRRAGSRRSSSGSTAQPLDVGDDGDRRAHTRRSADAAPGGHARSATRKQKRSPAPPFTTSTLQQEASRKLGFSPKRTMSVAQRLYEGVDTPDGHVGLITYMRTDSMAIAGVAMGEARDVIRERYGEPVHDAQGPRLQDEVEGRPGGARVDPADELPARPGLARGRAQARGASALPADLAAGDRVADGGEGARDDDGRARRGAVRAAGAAPRRRCSTASPASTRRAATTRRPRTTRSAACRRSPRATGRRVEDVTPTQHFTEPPPRFTEATLIKALEEHGIGRPSTYAATISTIVDRGYVRVEERRLHPELVGEHRDRPPRRALRRLRRPRVHRPDGGGARRGRPRRARLGAAAAGLLRAPARPRRREAPRAHAQRLHDRGDRRGLLARPPDGHPARPERAVPRVLAVSRAQGVAAAAGRGAAAAGGRGRGLPEVRRGHAGRQARPVRAVRRLLALPRLRLHQAGGAAAARSAAVRGHLPQERRRPPRLASRPPDRQRLLGVLELPEVRLHDELRAGRRPSTTRTTGPVAQQGRDGDLPEVRRDDVPLPDGRSSAGEARGRAAEPGGARAAGPRRRRGGGGRRRGRRPRRGGADAAARRGRARRHADGPVERAADA